MGRKTHPESRVTFLKSPTAQNKYARRRKARRTRGNAKVQNPSSPPVYNVIQRYKK